MTCSSKKTLIQAKQYAQERHWTIIYLLVDLLALGLYIQYVIWICKCSKNFLVTFTTRNLTSIYLALVELYFYQNKILTVHVVTIKLIGLLTPSKIHNPITKFSNHILYKIKCLTTCYKCCCPCGRITSLATQHFSKMLQ